MIVRKPVSSKPYGTKSSRQIMSGTQSIMKPSYVLSLTDLPPKALSTILSYDMWSYRKMMSVCASWYVSISEAFDQYFNKVENDFAMRYQQHLSFTNSFTSWSAIKFWGKKGTRVDRVLVCDILPFKKHLNKTLKISLSFRYHGDPATK